MGRVAFSSLGIVVVALLGCSGCSGDTFTGADSGVSDGASDTSPTQDAAGSCWPYAPANYDPCLPGFAQNHPTTGAKVVTTSETLDTGAASDTLADGSVTYALYHFTSLTVTSTGTLTIKGPRPALIVVEEDVDIEGPIVVANGVLAPTDCGVTPDSASPTTNWSAGAGGGGYGGAGGGGGSGPTGGALNGNPKIAPLRAGCPGGASGAPKPVSNGGAPAANSATGGLGGGALEISARGNFTIGNTASIVANGKGGQGGDAHKAGDAPCKTADSKDCDSGGGGGGSGGSLLLEAVNMTVMGSVCAVGGGGGAGGAQGGVSGAGGGTSTDCTVALGGAGPTPVGGAGGTQKDGGTGSAVGGGSYTSTGGGGGGAGRIRIRASGKTSMTGNVVPPAYTL